MIAVQVIGDETSAVAEETLPLMGVEHGAPRRAVCCPILNVETPVELRSLRSRRGGCDPNNRQDFEPGSGHALVNNPVRALTSSDRLRTRHVGRRVTKRGRLLSRPGG